MNQLITKFDISLVEYENDVNFPSYRTNRKNPVINNINIINDLNNYNSSSGQILLNSTQIHIFTNARYLYIREISNNLFNINDILNTSIFLFSDLDNSIILENSFVITNNNIDNLTIEYYCLSNK